MPTAALAAAALLSAAPSVARSAPGLVGLEIGTTSTIAGPEFCPGKSTLDQRHSTVRALAVARSGRVYLDTGRTSQGTVATIDPEGNAALVPTAMAGPGSRRGARVDISPPSRLAGDGADGVVMAVGARLVRVFAGGGAAVLSGNTPARIAEGGEGDGGPLTAARFTAVASVASDEAGRLFVAERVGPRPGRARIRLANRGSAPLSVYPGTPHELTIAPGSIDSVVGTSGAADSGSAAMTARIDGAPPAMAVSGDRLYIATSTRNEAVRRTQVQLVNLGGAPMEAHGVTVAPGAIETVAGATRAGFGGDAGPARGAAFSYIPGIAVDDAANLYLADAGNHRVRKVDSAGVVTTFAGTGGTGAKAGGFNGNDRPANDARLNRPYDVKAGPAGRIYISDQLNRQLRFVDEAGIIHIARGNGIGLTWTCPARPPPKVMGLEPLPAGTDPAGIAAAGASVYFAVPGVGSVMTVNPAGTVSPLVVPSAEKFSKPRSVALSSTDGLYVLDDGLILTNLGQKPLQLHGTTVAPGASATVLTEGSGRGFLGPSSLLPPGSVAASSAGDVFIADSGGFFTGTIRRLDRSGQASTFAGTGTALMPTGCCGQPAGLAVDPRGNLYVASASPPQVWLVNRGGGPLRAYDSIIPPGTAQVVAGTGKTGFGGDGGPATEAQLRSPRAATVGPRGELYISDAGEHTIRKVDARGVISTVAGTGTAAFNGDGLKAGLTALSTPSALAMDSCGNLLVADTGNNRLRRVNLAGTCTLGTPGGAGGGSPVPSVVAVLVLGTAVGAAGGVVVAFRRRRRH